MCLRRLLRFSQYRFVHSVGTMCGAVATVYRTTRYNQASSCGSISDGDASRDGAGQDADSRLPWQRRLRVRATRPVVGVCAT